MGCTPDFQSASDVNDLRVLAIQADPPEAQFDAQGAAPDVQVRVLAVDPARNTPMVLTGALCAPTDSRRCEDGPRFDLPPQTRTTGTEFAGTIPGALLGPVIAYARESDDLKGLGGIRVMLAISIEDGDPKGAVAADKILLYTPAGTPPNHNPQMSGVALTETGVPTGQVADGETLSLPVGAEIGLRPLLAEGAREAYDTTDLQGKTVHLVEQPRYFFFTTPGAEIDRDTADEPLDGVAPPDGLARIKALTTGSGTLWIVVRDGRGGEAWLAIPWTAG